MEWSEMNGNGMEWIEWNPIGINWNENGIEWKGNGMERNKSGGGMEM